MLGFRLHVEAHNISFPLNRRCALLSSLRPLTKEEEFNCALSTHPMGQLFSCNSNPWLETTPTMVSLSPLFILSAVLRTVWNQVISEGMEEVFNESKGISCGANRTSRDILLHLSSFLGQVQYGKYLDSISKIASKRIDIHTLSAATYLAIDRIHELCDLTLRVALDSHESLPDMYGPIIREILSRPLSVLAFILGRRFVPELSTRDDDTQRRRANALYDAVEETYRSRRIAMLSTCAAEVDERLSLDARILKWKCLANTCLQSTVSEMSQIRSRSTTSKARYDVLKRNDSIGCDGDESVDERTSSKNPLIWLLRSAFADEAASFRFTATREIGRILMKNKSSLLYALFSTPSNWRRQEANLGISSLEDESLHAALEHVVIPLFLEIDRLLCRYCHIPQSQLSFTMGPSVVTDKASAVTDMDASMLSLQRSAVMVLSSLCQYAYVESPCGLLVFEHALARLIRLWTAIDEENMGTPYDTLDCVSTSSIVFSEMSRLNEIRSIQSILLKSSRDRFMPRLFSDILVPSSGMISNNKNGETPGILERENRERQFRLLLTFIGSFLLPIPEKPACDIKTATANGSYCMHCVLEFVDEVLPSVISAFIMSKDHDSLLLVTGFKLFVMGEDRKIDKAIKKAARSGAHTSEVLRDEILGSSPRAVAPKTPGIEASTKELVEHTKLLCLAPDMIEHILPRILMTNDSSQLLFFLEVVLQKKMSLQQMVSLRDKLILKALVWEFGRTCDVAGADRALRTAAKARKHASMDGDSGYKDACELESGGEKQGDDNAAACLWVTSSFMYLLVNVVQFHWQSRTLQERSRALCSLKWIIKFLLPAEAPQYLPQIMATVNMVMCGESNGTWQLRLLAIQALSEFIRTAIQSQYEMIGSNLATIVVSLFPVLSADESTVRSDNETRAHREAAKVAVDLLEWLTQGGNGQNLALYFRDVPFLPSTKALDKVRDALKMHGVSFDDLVVFSSTQNTPHTLSVRDSLTSDGGASHGDDDRKETAPTYSSIAQSALRRRLNVVRRLFCHENTSVRRVVLQHLIDLLRANRRLFNKLVESEEGTSLNRFITVRSGSGTLRSFWLLFA